MYFSFFFNRENLSYRLTVANNNKNLSRVFPPISFQKIKTRKEKPVNVANDVDATSLDGIGDA